MGNCLTIEVFLYPLNTQFSWIYKQLLVLFSSTIKCFTRHPIQVNLSDLPLAANIDGILLFTVKQGLITQDCLLKSFPFKIFVRKLCQCAKPEEGVRCPGIEFRATVWMLEIEPGCLEEQP